MVEEGDWVAIFHSIHRVMEAERRLKQQKIPMLLIPVPRQLSSDCGLAIRFEDKGLQDALDDLASQSLTPVELYRMTDGKYVLHPKR